MSNEELAIRLLGLKMHAQYINDNATLNYWMNGTEGYSDMHIKWIHRDFARMAEILGYEIKRIEPEA